MRHFDEAKLTYGDIILTYVSNSAFDRAVSFITGKPFYAGRIFSDNRVEVPVHASLYLGEGHIMSSSVFQGVCVWHLGMPVDFIDEWAVRVNDITLHQQKVVVEWAKLKLLGKPYDILNIVGIAATWFFRSLGVPNFLNRPGLHCVETATKPYWDMMKINFSAYKNVHYTNTTAADIFFSPLVKRI